MRNFKILFICFLFISCANTKNSNVIDDSNKIKFAVQDLCESGNELHSTFKSVYLVNYNCVKNQYSLIYKVDIDSRKVDLITEIKGKVTAISEDSNSIICSVSENNKCKINEYDKTLLQWKIGEKEYNYIRKIIISDKYSIVSSLENNIPYINVLLKDSILISKNVSNLGIVYDESLEFHEGKLRGYLSHRSEFNELELFSLDLESKEFSFVSVIKEVDFNSSRKFNSKGIITYKDKEGRFNIKNPKTGKLYSFDYKNLFDLFIVNDEHYFLLKNTAKSTHFRAYELIEVKDGIEKIITTGKLVSYVIFNSNLYIMIDKELMVLQKIKM